jgi:hypothetical protein
LIFLRNAAVVAAIVPRGHPSPQGTASGTPVLILKKPKWTAEPLGLQCCARRLISWLEP